MLIEDLEVPKEYEIVISIQKDGKVPNCKVTYQIATDEVDGDDIQYIKQAYMSLVDRPNPGTKEYAMANDTYIMYDRKSAIVGILVKDRIANPSEAPDPHVHDELHRFLELAGDMEAIEGYKMMVYHWAMLHIGLSMLNNPAAISEDGQIYVVDPDSIEEEDEE